MKWNSTEVGLGSQVAAALASFPAQSATPREEQELCLSRKDAGDLIEGVALLAHGQPVLGIVPIRHLFRQLRFDESHPFQWRLEHKLVQALVLQHFCVESMPATCGLIRYMGEHPDRADKDKVRQDLSFQYLKPALGHTSLHQNQYDRDYAVEKIWRDRAEIPSELIGESWIVQEKLAILKEYRIHSLEDSVVEDLTYVNRLHRCSPQDSRSPNAFVTDILKRLPHAFVAHSLIGWDVAEVEGGRYMIVEANWAGFHPVGSRGFQCSGVLSQIVWGPYAVARLLKFVESKYRVKVRFDHAIADNDELGWIYWWISQWMQLLQISGTTAALTRSLEELAGTSSPGARARYAEAEQLLSQFVARFHRIGAMLE